MGEVIHKSIGQTLRKERESLRMPQEIFSLLTSVESDVVESYENGDLEIPASYLYVSSIVLGVTIEKFYSDIENEPISSANVS